MASPTHTASTPAVIVDRVNATTPNGPRSNGDTQSTKASTTPAASATQKKIARAENPVVASPVATALPDSNTRPSMPGVRRPQITPHANETNTIAATTRDRKSTSMKPSK